MQCFPAVKCCTVALCFLILAAELVNSAPSYSDYENFRHLQTFVMLPSTDFGMKIFLKRGVMKGVRDLYELLLQKEALENRLQAQGQHEIVRKANRSPSLRLRFGRRADPLLAGSPYNEHSSVENSVAEN